MLRGAKRARIHLPSMQALRIVSAVSNLFKHCHHGHRLQSNDSRAKFQALLRVSKQRISKTSERGNIPTPINKILEQLAQVHGEASYEQPNADAVYVLCSAYALLKRHDVAIQLYRTIGRSVIEELSGGSDSQSGQLPKQDKQFKLYALRRLYQSALEIRDPDVAQEIQLKIQELDVSGPSHGNARISSETDATTESMPVHRELARTALLQGDLSGATALLMQTMEAIEELTEQGTNSQPARGRTDRPQLLGDGHISIRLLVASLSSRSREGMHVAMAAIAMLQQANRRGLLWDRDQRARILAPAGVAAGVLAHGAADVDPVLGHAAAALACGAPLTEVVQPPPDAAAARQHLMGSTAARDSTRTALPQWWDTWGLPPRMQPRTVPPRALASFLLKGVAMEGSAVGLLRLLQEAHSSHRQHAPVPGLPLEYSPGDIRAAVAQLVASVRPRGSEQAAAGGIAAAMVGLARPAACAPEHPETATAALAAAWGERERQRGGLGGSPGRDVGDSLHAVATARGHAERTALEASAVGLDGEPTPRAVPVYPGDAEAQGEGGGWAHGLSWPGATAVDGETVVGASDGETDAGAAGALIAVPDADMSRHWASEWVGHATCGPLPAAIGSPSWSLVGARTLEEALQGLRSMGMEPDLSREDGTNAEEPARGEESMGDDWEAWVDGLGDMGVGLVPAGATRPLGAAGGDGEIGADVEGSGLEKGDVDVEEDIDEGMEDLSMSLIRWLVLQPLPSRDGSGIQLAASFGASPDALVLLDPSELPLPLEVASSPAPAAAALALGTYLWEQAPLPDDAGSDAEQDDSARVSDPGPLQGQPAEVVQMACEAAALAAQPGLAWSALSQGVPELSAQGRARDAAALQRRMPHLLAALAAAAEAATRSSRAGGRPDETLTVAEAALRGAAHLVQQLRDTQGQGQGGDPRRAVLAEAPRLATAFARACLQAQRPRLAAATLLPGLGQPGAATMLRGVSAAVVVALARAGDEEGARQLLQAMASAPGCGVTAELREHVQEVMRAGAGGGGGVEEPEVDSELSSEDTDAGGRE